jgi:hypothetical protein
VKFTIEQIRDLLALRCDGARDERYWREFLVEFHLKQRERAVSGAGAAGLRRCAAAWFSGIARAKWADGAGLAYAAVTVACLLSPRQVHRNGPPDFPVIYQVVPASGPPAAVKHPARLRPRLQDNAEGRVF